MSCQPHKVTSGQTQREKQTYIKKRERVYLLSFVSMDSECADTLLCTKRFRLSAVTH